MLHGYPLLNFLSYLVLGIALWIVSLAIYIRITPMREWDLIPAGNVAAALTTAGAAIGLALPIGSLAIHAVNVMDMLLWAIVSLAVQLLFYVLAGRWARRLGEVIAADNRAVGVIAGAFALCLGIISACSLTA